MMKLPSFQLLANQPKVPHVARIAASNAIPNEYGTPILYKVYVGRNGKSWWIAASLNGMRMSNTIHTTVETKAKSWIKAVESGQIAVEES